MRGPKNPCRNSLPVLFTTAFQRVAAGQNARRRGPQRFYHSFTLGGPAIPRVGGEIQFYKAAIEGFRGLQRGVMLHAKKPFFAAQAGGFARFAGRHVVAPALANFSKPRQSASCRRVKVVVFIR